jgi:hypothetical protein
VGAIQLTHTVEVEYLHAGTVMDGATAFWQGATGVILPAEPVEGWRAHISPQANNPLNGAGAFADSLLVLSGDQLPRWRVDMLPLPSVDGGPWRLRLEFASNSRWRKRGWFIAGMIPLTTSQGPAFPIVWKQGQDGCPAGLFFSFPYPAPDFRNPVVQFFDENLKMYMDLPRQEGRLVECTDGFLLARDFILDTLKPSGLTRHLLRVLAMGPKGEVASSAVVVYPDNGARPVPCLERPYPNPSTGGVKFLLDIPPDKPATLKIFDLRGRLVYHRSYSSGRHQVFWSGTTDEGKRLASGTYYLKLDGSDFASMRKVVLIR